MHIIFSLFVLLTTNLDSLVKNSPSEKDYPKAGAIILLDYQTLEINPAKGGTQTLLSGELVVKILNERGKVEYADIKRRYDANTQEFKVITAQTHSPDGKITQVGKDAINDLSAEEVMYASAYTNARMKVVSFPAIERDAIIEYRYEITGKATKEPIFFGEVLFASEEPILKKEFMLTVPAKVEFNYKLVTGSPDNGNIEPQVNKAAGKVTYTWGLSGIQAIIPEPYMPPFAEFAPRLVYSSFTSWEKLADWLGEQFYKSAGVNKEMQKKVEKIAKDKPNEEIIKDLFLFTLTEFREVYLRLGLAGYTPTKAEKVWFNKYGDPRDKVVLLHSLLKSAGIKSFPVFINDNNVPVVKEVPSPSMFDWIILAVPLAPPGFGGVDEGKWFLLDPMAVNCELGYLPEEEQGVEGFVVFPGKNTRAQEHKYIFKQTIQLPKEKSVSDSYMKLVISSEGNLNGDVSTQLSGFYGRKVRVTAKNKTQKEKKMWMESGVTGICADAKLLTDSISDLKDLTVPAQINFSFSADRFATIEVGTSRQGGTVSLHFFIPENPFNFAGLSEYTGLTKRKYPLLPEIPRIIQSNGEIEIPEGFTVDWLPPAVAIDNELASVNIKMEALENKITYSREFVFKQPRIEQDEYSKFTSLTSEFLKSRNRMVILKPIAK